MEQSPPRGRLANAIAVGVTCVLVLLALVIYIGAKLSSDWLTIWSAVTAIGAFVALAALFAAAAYSREQYHATLEASRIETQRANDQIEADRQNADLEAANAQAQLDEAKSANKATQDFERVRLTREVLKEYTDLSERSTRTGLSRKARMTRCLRRPILNA